MKWAIDPGLDGDVYSDKPHLYGPLLSSINVLRVGDKAEKKGEGWEIPSHAHEDGIEEGGDGEGVRWREEKGAPTSDKERKKWALDAKHREGWSWDEGRVYRGDFFNPYLDFNGKTSGNVLGWREKLSIGGKLMGVRIQSLR